MPISVLIETSNGYKYQPKDVTVQEIRMGYSPEGSGFLSSHLVFDRNLGVNYSDIEIGAKVWIRYYDELMFYGLMMEIEESDKLTVRVFGLLQVLSHFSRQTNFIYDTRLDQWRPPGERRKNFFAPELFNAGSTTSQMYIQANSGDEIINSGDYMSLKYSAPFSGSVERVSFDYIPSYGVGVPWAAIVVTADNSTKIVEIADRYGTPPSDFREGEIFYCSNPAAGSATFASFDLGLRRITMDSGSDLTGWNPGDWVYIISPALTATITSVTLSGDSISYSGPVEYKNTARFFTDINIVINTTRSEARVMSAWGANSITFGANDYVPDWEFDDNIIINTPLWRCLVATVSGTTTTYDANYTDEHGLIIPSPTWPVYNLNRANVAFMSNYDSATNTLTFTEDVAALGWQASDTLYSYTPFQLEVVDSSGANVIPSSNRFWYIPNRYSISLTLNNSSSAEIRFGILSPGSANQNNTGFIDKVSVQSNQELDKTFDWLLRHVQSELNSYNSSVFPLTSVNSSSSVDKVIKPWVIENQSYTEALFEAASYGNSSNNLICWGFRFDDTSEMFCEEMNPTETYYVDVTPSARAISSYSFFDQIHRARGVYIDFQEEEQYTDWNSGHETENGFFNSRIIDFRSDNVTEAERLRDQFIADAKEDKVKTSFEVSEGQLKNQFGHIIPLWTLRPGVNLALVNYKAEETGGSGVGYESQKKMIQEISFNLNEMKANVIFGEPVKTFDILVRNIERVLDAE